MILEDQNVERKSLRLIMGKTADWNDIAKSCISFANAQGGCLLIGIEDGQLFPPLGQTIAAELLEHTRIGIEVSRSQLKRTLADLVNQKQLIREGELNNSRYRLATNS